MTIDNLVKRVADGGNLLKNLGLLQDANSWQTAREVFADWQAGAQVAGVSTANMGVYRLVDGEAVFDLLGKDGNLFVDDRFRKDAYNGIVGNEFFFPQGEMKEHVLSAISAKQSVTIKYSGLNINAVNCSSDYRYVETGKNSTDEEKKLFSAVYGADNPGNGMRIYLLRGNAVKQQLRDRTDDFVVRACYFGNGQSFNAYDRDINYCGSAVRGVRCVKVAEGDAQRSSLLAKAYTTILASVDTLDEAQVSRLYTALQSRVKGAVESK